MSVKIAHKAHKATAGGEQTYLQSASVPISFPPPCSAEDRVEIRRSWHRRKKKVEVRRSSAGGDCFIYSPSFLTFLLLLLSLSVFREEEGRRGERSSLPLRPECLAVLKWRAKDLFLSAKANSLCRQVGQHTYTHPHLGHRLVCPCLCLYAGWQPSHQLRSQWAQRITMATNIVGQAVAALG